MLKRLTKAILGLIICGMGVYFIIEANFGVDPNSVFVTGIGKQLNTSYGIASLLINAIIIGIVFIIDRKYVSLSSLLACFLIGFAVDGSAFIFKFLKIAEQSIGLKIISFIFGIFIMCYGIVLYIEQDLGVGAFDSISELISDKTGKDFKFVRITVDVTFLILGYLLGGSLGVGTVAIALTTGPTIKLIRKTIFNKN